MTTGSIKGVALSSSRLSVSLSDSAGSKYGVLMYHVVDLQEFSLPQSKTFRLLEAAELTISETLDE